MFSKVFLLSITIIVLCYGDMSRVISETKPLSAREPNQNDYESDRIIILMDIDCVNEKELNNGITKTDLFGDLFGEEQDCLQKTGNGGDGNGIYHSTTDYFAFATLIGDAECLEDINIDYQAYCLSDIYFSPKVHGFGDYTCGDNTNPFNELYRFNLLLYLYLYMYRAN